MKIGFSSLVCPDWDLPTIVANAAAFKFDAVELRGLHGQLNLPAVPALAAEPETTKALFAEAGVKLACLGSSASFTSSNPKEVAENQAQAREYIELAAALDCPAVRVFAGEVPRGGERHSTLARVGDALRQLAPFAARHRVEILVENQGDFSRSKDIWYLLDAVSQPGVKCCWNPAHGLIVNERPTISIPRLGKRISMVHVTDIKLAGPGELEAFVEPGTGDAEIERMIDLLRGVGFSGTLVFEWPKLWTAGLPEPDKILPKVQAFLTKCIKKESKPLTAYKGDKNAPKFGPAPTGPRGG